MSDGGTKRMQVGAGATLGFGSVLAIAMSWSANHAIGWAVLHGFFGWGYVVYYLFTHDGWTWFLSPRACATACGKQWHTLWQIGSD